MRYKSYLKGNKRITFTIMQINGTPWKHLTDVDKQAEEIFNQLVKYMAKAEGIIEIIYP